jgi:hypothetical protein
MVSAAPLRNVASDSSGSEERSYRTDCNSVLPTQYNDLCNLVVEGCERKRHDYLVNRKGPQE